LHFDDFISTTLYVLRVGVHSRSVLPASCTPRFLHALPPPAIASALPLRRNQLPGNLPSMAPLQGSPRSIFTEKRIQRSLRAPSQLPRSITAAVARILPQLLPPHLPPPRSPHPPRDARLRARPPRRGHARHRGASAWTSVGRREQVGASGLRCRWESRAGGRPWRGTPRGPRPRRPVTGSSPRRRRHGGGTTVRQHRAPPPHAVNRISFHHQ
jgi:hypothetical protein